MNKVLKAIAFLVMAIAPANALSRITDDNMRIYCNGNSLQIIEQYEKEIVSGKTHPALILADMHHILQIVGINKTLLLFKELTRNATTDAEKLYVQDIVQLLEELNLNDTTKSNTRWDIYDNSKERMPKSIPALQCNNSPCFLSDKNKLRVAQYQNGFIPVQQYTQDYMKIGLCSSSFKVDAPVTLAIYSNMDYVCYINGKKICVNAITDKKKLVRMFHIEPEGGFTVAIYYQPVEDMFLKVQFYDDDNQIVRLPNMENSFFHTIQWYESYYAYEKQLLTQYNTQRSAEALLQLALFYESLQSTEALKYYKEALQSNHSNNEFMACRLLSLLLKYQNQLKGTELIMNDILKSNERYTSTLWHYYYHYIYNKQSLDITQINYLPLLIYLLDQEKKELIHKKVNCAPLLEQYPLSNAIRYSIAEMTAQYDIKKAIEILESISQPNDKEMVLLLQYYEQDQQFDKIVSILERNTVDKYFDTYIQALIALKRYNDAKSALFKRIAQGFDSQAYTLLATIAELEDSDGSMYRQKHEVIVSGIPWHSDYMKDAFDNYVHNTVFSRLAFETIHPSTAGLLNTCYALRIIDTNAYCSIYDLYYINSVTLVNYYAFSTDVTITGCTIYLVDEQGEIEKKKITCLHNSLQKEIEKCFKENLNKYALIEISFIVQKDIPVVHIQQNYNRSQFDMDIIVMHPLALPYVVSAIQGSVSKGDQSSKHVKFTANELSAHNDRDFIVMAIMPEDIVEWINEQNVRFKIADYLVTDTELHSTTIEDNALEITNKLKQYTIIQNPYTATSLIQFISRGNGTMLDALLYARYKLAKNGIMSYIAVGCSHSEKTTQSNNNGLYFDTVLLYIPLTAEKGIWLTWDGTYTSLDEITVDTVFLIVGDEVIQKTKKK
ncbi:MAG: hypothetical protein ACUVRK_02455 [Spirochaetota bacterium]